MSLLQTQVVMAKARWVELRERLKVAPKIKKKRPRIRLTDAQGSIFVLHYIHRLSYQVIGGRFGFSGATARTKCNQMEVAFWRRSCVPIFHDLQGDTWIATNCWYARHGSEHSRYSPIEECKTQVAGLHLRTKRWREFSMLTTLRGEG